MDGSIDTLKSLYDIWLAARDGSFNSTANHTSCDRLISQDLFFFWVLLPSAVIVIILMFFVKRLRLCPNFLFGRPGILIPMDFLDDRGLRLSYAAVYGLTSSLCLKMILQDYPFKINGPLFLTAFAKLGSMLVYGFALYPLLAVITTGTVLSLTLGTLYAWMFFIINMIHVTDCAGEFDAQFYMVMVFLPAIPELACSVFLSVSIPLRLIRILIRKWRAEEKSEFFDNSYQAEYVRQLFTKPPKWCFDDDSTNMKLKDHVKDKIEDMAFDGNSAFRYSPRILSTFSTGVILLYLISYNVGSPIITFLDAVMMPFWLYIEESNDTRTLFEVYENISSVPGEIGVVRVLYHWLDTGYIVICLSLAVSSAIGVVQAALGLRAYRKDLLSAYKGNFSNAGLGYPSLMRAFACYSGYQVAYIFWGFLLQFIVISVVLALLSYSLFIPLIYGRATWFLDYVQAYWPVTFVTLVVYIGLQTLAKCVFLQGKGKIMAIDNRRLLFCVMYFLFFYNIFVGLFSCLLRMVKASVIGLLFLGRLDSSPLPKKFETMDPGFSAYVGLIQVEKAHNHPILVTFVKIVQEAIRERRVREREHRIQSASLSSDTCNIPDGDELGQIERMRTCTERDEETSSERKGMQIRARWFLTYTLINNLPLRATRKHYIDAERERHRKRFRNKKAGIGDEVEVVDPSKSTSGQERSTSGDEEAEIMRHQSYQTF